MKLLTFAAASTLILTPLFSRAADDPYTWNGGGTDNNWSSGANWNGGIAPPNPQNQLHFAGSTRVTATNDFAAGAAGHRIFFDSGASSFTLGGNGIRFFDFGGLVPKIENNSSSPQTLAF